MKDAYANFGKQTPQSEPIPGREEDMIRNAAGGYTFSVDDWGRLDRFLILGSEGGTYYVGQREHTADNAKAVMRCIAEDGPKTVLRIVEISEAGRAPKNDPALFALAVCAGKGDDETRKLALEALPRVARIGTHLFSFLTYVQNFRGWGTGLKRAVANWYNGKELDRLAYQVAKYQGRNFWSNRDVLRKCHASSKNSARNDLYKWIVSGEIKDGLPDIILAMDKASKSEDPIPGLILKHGLTREMVPTQWLNSIGVWEELLENMPITALIRNLGKMTAIGLVKPMSDATKKVISYLSDEDKLRRGRVHPISILVAMSIYKQGHGMKGKLSWDPVTRVIDALDEAFYASFGFVEKTGKKTLLALDVSASMTWDEIAGMPITPRVGSAAMAMVTARTEDDWEIMAFADSFRKINISPSMRLDEVVRVMFDIPMGGTNCSLPFKWAQRQNIPIDSFIVYTDNETRSGGHPAEALRDYRQALGIDSKSVVVGMTATQCSIADPNDPGMLDVVGFDTATPNVIAEFCK